MRVEFVYASETKRTYVFQQPRDKNTSLATTSINIKKDAFPGGRPSSITLNIEVNK